MGIDIDFMGTKHRTWHNIWSVELFCLIHAYALRKISRKRFNIMLIVLGQEYQKSTSSITDEHGELGALSEGMDPTLHKDGVKRDKHGKPLVGRTIRIEKISEEMLGLYPFHGDVKDGMAFAISVDPPINPELVNDADMKVFRYFVGHHERQDVILKIIGDKQLVSFTNSDGDILSFNECRELLTPTMMMALSMSKQETETFWDEITEVMGEEARKMFGGIITTLVYAYESKINIRIT